MKQRKKWNNLVLDKSEVVIELGCGNKKRYSNSIGIDILDLKNVDIVTDLNDGLSFIPDKSVDKIYSNHFLEHVEDVSFMLSEIMRVLKKGGLKIGWVPHWSNPYYYSDPTHKVFFGLYTFSYYSSNSIYKRDVPKFYSNGLYHLEKNLLLIKGKKSEPGIVSKVFMKIINYNSASQEIYERYIAKIVAVDEIHFYLRRE